MNLNISISASWLFGFWGTPRDQYWCIKSIYSELMTLTQRGGLWTFSANLALCAPRHHAAALAAFKVYWRRVAHPYHTRLAFLPHVCSEKTRHFFFFTRGIEFRDGGKKLRFTSPHLAPRFCCCHRAMLIFTEVNLVSTFFSKFAGFLRAMGFH